MKVYISILTIFFTCLSAFSQENSIYTNDYLTPFITNPACTGAEYYPVVKLSVKKQWLGFPGSPSTYLLAGNYRIGTYDFYNPKGLVNTGPLNLKNRVGVGTAIFRDSNGPLINSGGILSYAYHFPVNRRSKLSFGMSTTLMHHSISTSILEPYETNDDFLFSENNRGMKINFSAGALYYNSTYFFGLAANKLLRDISNANEIERNVTSYFLMSGYKFNVGNDNINYEPSFSIKKINKEPLIIDIHSKFYIQKIHWIAVSYSSVKQLNIQFALRIYNKIYAGYNYGYSISNISGYNYGSHEISLGINLGLIGVEGIRNTANN